MVVIPSICVAITALLVPSSQGNLSDPLYGVILLSPFAVLAIFESHHRFGEVFTDGTSAWSRIYQIISRPLPISAPPTTKNISQDSISLSNATFRWDTKVPACENVSFELSEDIRHLTIEGPSGSGKSTLAAGLVRFLELQNGEYLYGDINVQNLNENDVREHIVWSPQSPWLLPGTIRENLLLSCGEASDETLFNALESVNGLDFVKKFKKGLDHNIGIDGELLSLGEKNKIALARIILSPHKIRIFDEPSASLDHLSTTKLIENIYSDSDAHFSIIISHELEEMGAGERLILSWPTSTVD